MFEFCRSVRMKWISTPSPREPGFVLKMLRVSTGLCDMQHSRSSQIGCRISTTQTRYRTTKNETKDKWYYMFQRRQPWPCGEPDVYHVFMSLRVWVPRLIKVRRCSPKNKDHGFQMPPGNHNESCLTGKSVRQSRCRGLLFPVQNPQKKRRWKVTSTILN